ncbi:hypothetical protein B0T20DRAFT_4723 [Sordaria brevicollis]|uniref:Secreted protein n=1 Tax=Sordaria brevicollis TaxID=83679 RepID=A0AAE0PMW1_SORBR|nr:hypothetical protein B0T20DRAFT_4723 [Sordaria brevicollis]
MTLMTFLGVSWAVRTALAAPQKENEPSKSLGQFAKAKIIKAPHILPRCHQCHHGLRLTAYHQQGASLVDRCPSAAAAAAAKAVTPFASDFWRSLLRLLSRPCSKISNTSAL